VIQASLASNNSSPTKEHAESAQQLKIRIKELEDEMEEISQKYNEELRIERVNNISIVFIVYFHCRVRIFYHQILSLASSSGNSWDSFVRVRRGPGERKKGSPEFKSCLRRRLYCNIIIILLSLP